MSNIIVTDAMISLIKEAARQYHHDHPARVGLAGALLEMMGLPPVEEDPETKSLAGRISPPKYTNPTAGSS